MVTLTKKEKIGLGILVGAVLVASLFVAIKAHQDKAYENPSKGLSATKETPQNLSQDTETAPKNQKIFAHISGEVKNPGSYELSQGDRVNDLVHQAGGLTDYADLDRINLADEVRDKQKIYVLGIGEQEENRDAFSSNTDGDGVDLEKGMININHADEKRLCDLPGIGEVRAKAIVLYRQDKAFQTIEDIKQVEGIGEKLFEKIKDKIIVR